MRIPRVLLVLLVGAGLLSPASPAAAQDPPNVLFSGSSARTVAYDGATWCAVDSGISTFQRNGAADANIAFEQLTYFNGQYYSLSGLAALKFRAANKGTAYFDFVSSYPGAIKRPRFTKYKQTYDAAAREIAVSFNLRFESCVVPVKGVYRN